MKELFVLSAIVLGFGLVSCDKISNPVIVQTTLDTSLYPGNFAGTYVFPTFGPNTNTQKNVMLEDFTGHKCTFCPPAATEAANIEDANAGRVFVVSIHGGASNSGITDFQVSFPGTSKYYTDHTTPETREISSNFFQMGVGFSSNPQGMVNRITKDGAMFTNAGNWAPWTAEELDAELQVNIQAVANYYPSTGGVFIHTETEFMEDIDGEYNIVIYAIENKRIDWQLDGGVDIENYEHHNVLIGCVFGEAFGRLVTSGSIQAGTKIEQEFTYEVPDGLTNDDMHFIVFVYDKATFEVMQAIKLEF
ncbi:MAG: Omp28-related outer membrane protein [Crocinitomicaceae bacterium]|nr:Omp28-related outer membrane protein [Crocinitomicaceae bacterium]